MVNLTKADQMFGKNSQMSWQTEKACEKLGTIWDWTSSGPWSNGAEMTEKYLTLDARDIVIKKKQSIFIVIEENISSDWNTSINASRWN